LAGPQSMSFIPLSSFLIGGSEIRLFRRSGVRVRCELFQQLARSATELL
jgi:hypothetical protein